MFHPTHIPIFDTIQLPVVVLISHENVESFIFDDPTVATIIVGSFIIEIASLLNGTIVSYLVDTRFFCLLRKKSTGQGTV